jgi:hypothetical protein
MLEDDKGAGINYLQGSKKKAKREIQTHEMRILPLVRRQRRFSRHPQKFLSRDARAKKPPLTHLHLTIIKKSIFGA